MIVGNIIAKFGIDARGFTAGIAQINTVMTENAKTFNKARLAVLGYSAAITVAVNRATKWVSSVEAIERRMKAATKTTEANERAWKFLRQTSNNLGLSLEDLAHSYGSLAAALQGSNMQAEDTERLFTAISQRAAILGMESHRVRLTFLALEQMGSKGVIAMEELRRQFGEQIPGALGIFSRALGISVAEVTEWVKTGRLEAADVFPLLTDQMLREDLPNLSDLMTSMARSVAELQTAWFDLKKTMSGGVVKDALSGIYSATAGGVNNFNSLLKVVNKVNDGLKGMAPNLHSAVGKTMTTSILSSSIDLFKAAHKRFLPADTAPKETIEEGFMAIEEKAARIEEIKKKIFGKQGETFEDWAKNMSNTYKNILGEFTSTIVAMATGAEFSFSKMINNMLAKLLEFTTELLVITPLVNAFRSALEVSAVAKAEGLGSSSLLDAVMAGISAGFGAPAKKMASGGVLNEPVFGIGASGKSYLMGEAGAEAVVPMDQMGGRSANVNVTINANDSKSFADMLRRNPSAVVAPIVDALNKGDRGLSLSIVNSIGG